MRLTKVYVRFFKSFNYDYERKFHRTSTPDPWEDIDGAWYPFVRIDLEASITAIVGANESGKSHLLDTIERLITGSKIDRSEFCRYSRFFSVQQDERRSPDFGGEFELVNETDVKLAKKHLQIDALVGERFHLFRLNGDSPVIYRTGQKAPIKVEAKQSKLSLVLPAVFRLDAHVPLPASIPLCELAQNAKRPPGTRRSRYSVFDAVFGRAWSNAGEFAKAAPELYGLFSGGDRDIVEQQYELGRALLLKVAKIEPTTFEDLSEALANEREGYVNGVIQKINNALASHLNFPRWWAQDRDFRLMVSPREYELVFTIRDCTRTDYSFAERSSGLKYFLSYHVQLLAHRPPVTGQPEILLMDEPDAYLSSQGQQDLLRILEAFALPDDSSRQDQVVYVTHSPFLINRNAGDRIRVLDKGVTDEGTRVVKDVTQNHYEPLRSSLGPFVGETSFISGSNLFVEGLADQVLLAGVSSHLLAVGVPKMDTLDLNTTTIVPAGSASSVPYLVYLARGRDVVRPACVALLDSDEQGDNAVKVLARGGPRRKGLVPSEFVLQVGAWAETTPTLSIAPNVAVHELEDLLPIPVAVTAARNYAMKVANVSHEVACTLSEDHVRQRLQQESDSLFNALTEAFVDSLGPDAHIEKVGFAKEVIAVLAASRGAAPPPEIEELQDNFGPLLSNLARLLRLANQREEERRLNNGLNRTIAAFLDDYPRTTTREHARLLIEKLQASVEDSSDGDRVSLETAKLLREFDLDENLNEPINRYNEFCERIKALRYDERFFKRNEAVTVAKLTGEVRAGETAPDAPE